LDQVLGDLGFIVDFDDRGSLVSSEGVWFLRGCVWLSLCWWGGGLGCGGISSTWFGCLGIRAGSLVWHFVLLFRLRGLRLLLLVLLREELVEVESIQVKHCEDCVEFVFNISNFFLEFFVFLQESSVLGVVAVAHLIDGVLKDIVHVCVRRLLVWVWGGLF
jgi:hypothetical protein